jgi:hypothetical protein
MCKDKIEFLEAFDVTCRILLAQGCDHNLKELATSQGLSYPLEFPPEARVMDVCPLTCDVCKGKFLWLNQNEGIVYLATRNPSSLSVLVKTVYV